MNASAKAPGELRADIAHTRGELGATIEALHGRLNPSVLRDQALESFHEVKNVVTQELKTHLAEAKEVMVNELKAARAAVAVELGEARDAVKAELIEAKQAVKAELVEAKAAVKTEVRAEVEQVKVKLSDGIEHAKASVREATIGKVETMMHNVKDTIQETSHSVLDTIRANPIPAVLVGAGLTWLFISGRTQRRTLRDLDAKQPLLSDGAQRLRQAASGTRGAYEEVGEKTAHTGRAVSDAFSSAAHQVADFASDATHKLGDVSRDAGGAVARAAHTASESVVDFAQHTGASAARLARAAGTRSKTAYHANPLAIGAAVLAAGTAIGLAIPHTRGEDKLVGTARDTLFEKVGELAHEAIDKVSDAAAQLTAPEHEEPKRAAAADEGEDEEKPAVAPQDRQRRDSTATPSRGSRGAHDGVGSTPRSG